MAPISRFHANLELWRYHKTVHNLHLRRFQTRREPGNVPEQFGLFANLLETSRGRSHLRAGNCCEEFEQSIPNDINSESPGIMGLHQNNPKQHQNPETARHQSDQRHGLHDEIVCTSHIQNIDWCYFTYSQIYLLHQVFPA